MVRWYHNTVGTAGVSSSSSSKYGAGGSGTTGPIATNTPVVPAREKHASLTASQAYALKKRIFAPLWWLDGYLLKSSSRDAFGVELLRQRENTLAVVGPELSPKHMPLMFAIWNEFVAAAAAGPGAEPQVRIGLDRILRGTGSEIAELISVIETYWSRPFSLFQIQPSVRQIKKQKSYQMVSAGCINFVRHARVESAAHTELVLDLMIDLSDLCLGNMEALIPRAYLQNMHSVQTHTNVHRSALRQGFVSVNPDVLRAFGTGASAKKLSSYLFIEQVKLDESFLLGGSGWCGRVVTSKELPSFHRDLLSRTKALYDHGIFGWENGAPPMRISQLSQQQARDNAVGVSRGSVVHCWKLSSPALDAADMESAVLQKIALQSAERPSLAALKFKNNALPQGLHVPLAQAVPLVQTAAPRQPQAQSQSIVQVPLVQRFPAHTAPVHPAPHPLSAETSLLKSREVLHQSDVASSPSVERMAPGLKKVRPPLPEPQTLFDSGEGQSHRKPPGISWPAASSSTLASTGELLEHEFLVRVAEFYESLTPIQRLAFERQRSSMSVDQFRTYVAPILLRARRR